MKEKIKYLVLGILIGAVITASIFLIFKKDKSKFPSNGRPEGMPDMEQFENMDFENFKDRPDMPSRKKDESSNTTSENKDEKTPETTDAETKSE